MADWEWNRFFRWSNDAESHTTLAELLQRYAVLRPLMQGCPTLEIVWEMHHAQNGFSGEHFTLSTRVCWPDHFTIIRCYASTAGDQVQVKHWRHHPTRGHTQWSPPRIYKSPTQEVRGIITEVRRLPSAWHNMVWR